jgi:hypothetical protein
MGSGIVLNKAYEKHGIENFTKEILYEGEFYREEEELLLKTYDAANDSKSYNLKNESMGGSFPGELNGMYKKIHSKEARYKCGNAFRGKKRQDHSEKMKGENNPMYGKSYHTYGIVKKAKENKGKTFEEIHGEEKGKNLKKKLSLSQKGKKHNLKGVQCPHCSLEGSGPNMTRYHFDKCKKKDKK